MNSLAEFLRELFSPSGFTPRWQNGQWTGLHGWLYIISDLLIWVAFCAIPIIIIRYIRRRTGARFFRLYILFAAFILACGICYFFDALSFWYPLYRLNALWLLAAATLSWITVFSLLRFVPQAVGLKLFADLEKEVEQRSKAENKFRNLLESAPDAMVIVNSLGRIQLVNHQTEKVFGFSRQELVNQPVEILLPERFAHVHGSHRDAYFHEPRLRPMGVGLELFGQRKNGSSFPVEISLSPLETEDGLLVSAAIRDISYKKKLEDQIREANVTLEKKVHQRTAELERKNKELEQFAYVASHDLQEPLRTVSGFVELLRKKYQGSLDEHADQYIRFIVQASDRMNVLISDLLDYSRIGVKKEWQDVDCQQLLQEVVADLDESIRANQASIRFSHLPRIRGYATELKLLFQNLISNSLKFRKKEIAPEIEIKAEQKENHWLFVVSDNGIGMEKEHQEKIFIIFQRLHTRSEFAGSGIGLAHCKKIVELHGGRIWVESAPEKGSRFYFTIYET